MYLKHQIDIGSKAFSILKKNGYVYIAGKPRSGKTATAFYIAEQSTKINKWLIVTKKKAFDGWEKFLNKDINLNLNHSYTLINYESLHKIKDKYKGVIIDESHRLGSVPKPNKAYKELKRIAGDSVHIHLSGTAIVETPASIYHQMNFSRYSPFAEFRNFYQFFKVYGILKSIYIAGREVKQYKEVKPKLLEYINYFTLYISQEDAGIEKDIQAEDVLHFVELPLFVKKAILDLQKKKYTVLKGQEIYAESTMQERLLIHQLEGGTLKVPESDLVLNIHKEKIDYIKKTFDLTKKVGVMAHFRAEQELLKLLLPEVEVYSSNAHKEGVDLSHLDTFIIYSQDYSGASHIQRRERVVNINKKSKSYVHYLLCEPPALSKVIYEVTKRKEDFNNSTYRKEIENDY